MSRRRRARRLRARGTFVPNTTMMEGFEPQSVSLNPPLPEPEPVTYPRRLTTEELTGGKDDTQLTADLAAALRRIPVCSHCGGRHARACPRVKRMEFHPNGHLASVEFWAAGKWPATDIIWQEDLETDE